VAFGGEPGGSVDLRDGRVQRRLETRRRRDVLDSTTFGAHEMVVVVPGEIFRELETGVLVVGDDAVYDTGLLEDDEVAVDAALGQSAPDVEDLGDGERPGGVTQHIDERGAIRGHPLLDSPESSRDLMFECGLFECGLFECGLADVGRHGAECTVGVDGSD
jgi:hypothetical protein